MEIRCPICGSAQQKDYEFLVKFVEPTTNYPMEIPTIAYKCMDCSEDWQSTQQHKEFDKQKNLAVAKVINQMKGKVLK